MSGSLTLMQLENYYKMKMEGNVLFHHTIDIKQKESQNE
jgi:hypothetical protein